MASVGSVDGGPVRTLAVCCGDFPALASGRCASVPLAVLGGNEVLSATPAARVEGVRTGMRRREAEAACPVLEVVARDPERDARAFEKVMSALDALAPRWEVSSPGRCSVPSRGPGRFFGGEAATAAKVHAAVLGVLEDMGGRDPARRDTARRDTGERGAPRWSTAVGVAVADGPRAAAVLAERAASHGSMPLRSGRHGGAGPDRCVVVLAAGDTAAHLARLPVSCLLQGGEAWGHLGDRAELVDVLERLGLSTLGRYARLEPADVLSRFGRPGLLAHDLARGTESSLVHLSDLPVELGVSAAFDPPATTVEQVAFTARASAVEMHAGLAARGLVCTRVAVAVESAGGERVERLWRDEGSLDASGVAQRARWQLEGWVARNEAAAAAGGETSTGIGVVSLELRADQAVPDRGDQLGLWGHRERAPDRVQRGVARLDAMLGPGAVGVPHLRGGRSPGERYEIRPFGLEGPEGSDAPWPGALPAPFPAIVWREPAPVRLLDGTGVPVAVDGRGLLSSAPALCGHGTGHLERVVSWAGPWCIEEKWWDPVGHRRRARVQVLLGSAAHLVTLEQGQWWLEATYD